MLAVLRHALLLTLLAVTGISVAATDAHTVVEQTTKNLLADLEANKELSDKSLSLFKNGEPTIKFLPMMGR